MEVLRQCLGMGHVVFKHPLEHVLGLALLPLGHGVAVHIFKHKAAQVLQCLLHLGRKADGPCFPGNPDHVRHQGIDPGAVVVAQNIGDLPGNVVICQNARPDGIVNIVVDIGDLVTAADDLPFQGPGPAASGVAENAVPHLMGQVQAHAVPLQNVHHPQALLIVAEGLAQALGQGHLSRMAEGGMAQVVAHGNGLRQVLVEAQGPGNGAGDPGDLQGMGHAGAVVVSLRLQKDLGLVHQAAKGLAVHNSVNVPLVAGAHVLLPVRLLPGPSGGPVRKGGQGIQSSVFLTFQFFPYGHGNHSFILRHLRQTRRRLPFVEQSIFQLWLSV